MIRTMVAVGMSGLLASAAQAQTADKIECDAMKSIIAHAPGGFADIHGKTLDKDIFLSTITLAPVTKADGICMVHVENPAAPYVDCATGFDDEASARAFYDSAVARARACLAAYSPVSPPLKPATAKSEVFARLLFGKPEARRESLEMLLVRVGQGADRFYAVSLTFPKN